MDLREIGCEARRWMKLAQKWDQWWVLMLVVMSHAAVVHI